MHKIDHYSVSSINLAANCPRSWWSKYILKQDSESGEAASFGTEYDQCIGAKLGCTNHKPDGKSSNWSYNVEVAADSYLLQPHAFRQATDTQLKITVSPAQWNIMAETYGFYAEIRYPIIGYTDLYDRVNRVVVDLKTSSAKRAPYNWALQVLIYALALQANDARVHLMTRTKVPAYYDFKVPVTPDTLRWAMQTFTAQANQIERWLDGGAGDELARTPDPGYGYCSWCCDKQNCPAQNLILGV